MPSKPQTVSVIITGHGAVSDLPVILGSLEHQYEYDKGVSTIDGGAVYWVKGKKAELLTNVILTVDGDYEGDEHDWNLAPTEVGLHSLKIIENPKEGGVGHHTREPGIRAATGDWIVLTNSDNYFVSGWRHRIEQFICKPQYGMVYWDVVNNLQMWGTQGGSAPKRGYMDLSCAAVKTEIAKRVGFAWRDYEADWAYMQACMKLCRKEGLEIIHLEQTLSVHN